MFYPWTELEPLDKQRPRSAHDRSSQSRLLSLGLLKEEEIWIVGVGVLPFWEARMKMCVRCVRVPQSLVQVETKMQMTSGQGRNQTRTREKGRGQVVPVRFRPSQPGKQPGSVRILSWLGFGLQC